MTSFADWDDQTLDLCVEQFTVGLNGDGEATLGRLADPSDVEEFERAVAAVHLALLEEVEELPAAFRERLEQSGRRQVSLKAPAEHAGTTTVPHIVPPSVFPSVSPGTKLIAVSGWLIAASLLLILLPFGRNKRDVITMRDTLVADASDLVRAAWTATEDPAAAGASGEVVWSSARQEGYMRFEGLEPNDRAEGQYQLWIFDPTRADWEAKPVDGGVFDVPASGSAVVPIDPKLTVAETALFAITLEVPGGVVVSERERLVLTATPAL